MNGIIESQFPQKIRNPTTEQEKGWNACIAELHRIAREEATCKIFIDFRKGE